MEKLYSEEELIVLLQQKDNKAFEVFYDRYAPCIYALLLLHFKDTEKCLLLLQQIFLRFYTELNTASAFPLGLFISLYRIAFNTISENRRI